jgi:GDP-L-fucose synthase
MLIKENNDDHNDARFWAEHRFVVTGGTGFLGSWLVEALRVRGASEIFVPRREEYDLREVSCIREMFSQVCNDRTNAANVVVIHLAATVGGIGANQSRPAEFFHDNLVMGVQLLHESWRVGVGKFIGIGTACAYPKSPPVPFCEDSLWDGYPETTNAPYGIAKKMLLVQGQAYRKQYGFNSIHLLPTNLYGPRDNFDLQSSHVIPALIRKCHEAKCNGDTVIEAWGDGSPTRDFLYVKDAADGIALATEHYDDALPVNLGSGQEISTLDLANLIAKATGFDGEIVWNHKQPNGQVRRSLDPSRARRFGFEARTPLSVGLPQTIEWFRRHGTDL